MTSDAQLAQRKTFLPRFTTAGLSRQRVHKNVNADPSLIASTFGRVWQKLK